MKDVVQEGVRTSGKCEVRSEKGESCVCKFQAASSATKRFRSRFSFHTSFAFSGVVLGEHILAPY